MHGGTARIGTVSWGKRNGEREGKHGLKRYNWFGGVSLSTWGKMPETDKPRRSKTGKKAQICLIEGLASYLFNEECLWGTMTWS